MADRRRRGTGLQQLDGVEPAAPAELPVPAVDLDHELELALSAGSSTSWSPARSWTTAGPAWFEWWIAICRPKGSLCDAIRQPDGTWAELGVGDKYQLSGPVPGCGTLPVQDAEGFAYNQTSARSPDGRVWRIAYGYAPSTGHPVEIRDEVSGTTVPISDGGYFAIVMPQNDPGYRLQTIDAAGRTLVTDQLDPGE